MKKKATRHPIPRAVAPLGFQRLRNVTIERRRDGDYIRGDAGDSWNPLNFYHRRSAGVERPYVAFCDCRTDKDIKEFTEACGLINRVPGEGRRTASLRLAEFQFERWHFFLVHRLQTWIKRRRPELLREAFDKAVTDIEKAEAEGKAAGWYGVFHRIRDNIVLDGGLSRPAGFDDLRQRIKEASDGRLIRAARAYVSQVVRERLKDTRPWLDYEDGTPQLSASPSNLLAAFYFMLATDWTTDNAPAICQYCGDLFSSRYSNAAYCSNPECKRKGPLTTSWVRNGPRYNRERRKKRQQARLQKELEAKAGLPTVEPDDKP